MAGTDWPVSLPKLPYAQAVAFYRDHLDFLPPAGSRTDPLKDCAARLALQRLAETEKAHAKGVYPRVRQIYFRKKRILIPGSVGCARPRR